MNGKVAIFCLVDEHCLKSQRKWASMWKFHLICHLILMCTTATKLTILETSHKLLDGLSCAHMWLLCCMCLESQVESWTLCEGIDINVWCSVFPSTSLLGYLSICSSFLRIFLKGYSVGFNLWRCQHSHYTCADTSCFASVVKTVCNEGDWWISLVWTSGVQRDRAVVKLQCVVCSSVWSPTLPR